MKVALLLSGQLRGFAHAFQTWRWLLDQVTDTYYFCTMPESQQAQVRDLIPDAMGSYCHEFQLPKREIIPVPDEKAAIAMEHQFWKLRECRSIAKRQTRATKRR